MSAMISGQMSAGQTSYVSPQNRLVSEAPEQSERGSRFERYQRAGRQARRQRAGTCGMRALSPRQWRGADVNVFYTPAPAAAAATLF